MSKPKAKRRTIGESPLDTVVPAVARRAKEKPHEETSEPETSAPKERLTIHVSSDLVERLRDAVYWTPGLTLAGLAEEALSQAVDALEKKNRKPFPKRAGRLRLGRPMK
jgi:hypothetical protein